ncbi:DNA-directed RNA polymerase III, subunit Rpc31 [Geopyxis carbonaria]|nr:DNA-directed RNA polymerase III, subunit Rpc31 [Geopyxis carbonaria]
MVARHRSHREKIHNGPMYTVMVRNRGKEDPFNDVGKYSSKYTRQSRKAPKLDARPYVYDLFPSELYPTIGKDGSAGSKKRLLFSALDSLNRLDELPDAEDGDAEDGDEADRKKSGLLVGAEDLDHDADDGGSDEEPDDFADDEEGDYNAEQYFEDGDDIGDDYGDDDGGGYFD